MCFHCICRCEVLLSLLQPYQERLGRFLGGRFACTQNFQTPMLILLPADFLLQVMSFAMSISWTVYAHLGGTLDVPPTYDQSKSTGFVSWLSQTWCITGIFTTKIAVAALIMRLQGPSTWRTRILWALCSVSTAWAIIQIGFVWGQCHPTAALWDPQGHPNGKCWSPKVVVYNGMACSCQYFHSNRSSLIYRR